ncbi:hypothetical protein NDU88_002182 [Pleurodeles waltl]|uniref:Uncharacterized protein n=1 Tax=Pleurodeles waltl TaxID=8319 RepID=A0AAV7SA63_PLEWA|nr:hypothetical protein NDU88_002182 [Pleurodeles waltl]
MLLSTNRRAVMVSPKQQQKKAFSVGGLRLISDEREDLQEGVGKRLMQHKPNRACTESGDYWERFPARVLLHIRHGLFRSTWLVSKKCTQLTPFDNQNAAMYACVNKL